MRHLLIFMLLGVLSPASASTFRAAEATVVVKSVEQKSTFKRKNHLIKRWRMLKPFRELDRLAVWAIAFGATPILCTLIGFAIGGGLAGSILLLFSSPFFLVGFVIGLIAVIRAFREGWKRRGTVWAVVAMALPIIFLLLLMSDSFT